MTGVTHVTVGIAATAFSMKMGWVDPSVVTLGVAAVASLLPDIDSRESGIRTMLKINSAAYLILIGYMLYVQNYLMAAFLIGLLMFPMIVKHRSITHSLLAMALLYVFSKNLGYSMRFGLLVGYGMHIVADMFTKHGVELLFPYDKNFRVPFAVTTGKLVDWALGTASMLASVYWLFGIWAH